LNLNEHLPKYKVTFEDFRKWLYDKMNRDINKFKKFMTYPDEFKIIFLIQYLETKETPVLEALAYYAVLYPGFTDFITLQKYMIIMEFKLLEINKKINYVPF
jgi:aminopeptidase N